MASLVRKIARLHLSFSNVEYLRPNHLSYAIFRAYSSVTDPMAVILSDFGDPKKVLSREKIQVPAKIDGTKVLVKMLMAPINPSDINTIEGTYHLKPKLPSPIGNEGVGEVIDVADDVVGLKKGDWVLPAAAGWGTWRTHVVCEESSVQRIDDDIPVLSAATLAVNPCTAYRMLKEFVPLKRGDCIIQNGANSAVGQCVIQLAKEWGITTVNIIRDRPDCDELIQYLQKLGGTHVITEKFAFSCEMKDFLSDLPAPMLTLNCVGGKSATELTRFLAQRGVMVTYGGMSKKPVIIPTGALIFKEIRLAGYWNTQWNTLNSHSKEKVEMFKNLCDLIRNGKLLPPVSDLVPIERFEEAVADSLEGFRNQKKVLVMGE